MKKKISIIAILLLGSLIASCVGSVQGWSNGDYSADPSYPDYGTHDWIAQHALDWLPTQEKQYIIDNLASYLYGTELPDNNNAYVPGHIGDTTKHHVYFWANGSLQDYVAADRATEEYQTALNLLNAGNFSGAALTAGIMSHYIADLAVFAHVIGENTDWELKLEITTLTLKVMLKPEQMHILTHIIHTYYLMATCQQYQRIMLLKPLPLTLHSTGVEPTIVFG